MGPTTPALFEGTVEHRRFAEVEHRFRLGVFYAYLDVDTVGPTLDRLPLWSARHPAPVRFSSRDHLDGSGRPLGEAVRDLVAVRTGRRPTGPVMLLTQVRTLGFVFNPISVYFCWNEDASSVEATVLEVTNTPWNERCWYVLASTDLAPDGAWHVPKAMHVSPFLDMDVSYVVRSTTPGDRLRVEIEDRRDAILLFSARLQLRRVPLDVCHALLVALRHPLQTWRVFGAIHVHAVRLWRKGIGIRRHPSPAGSTAIDRPDPVSADPRPIVTILRRSPDVRSKPRPRGPHHRAHRAPTAARRPTGRRGVGRDASLR